MPPAIVLFALGYLAGAAAGLRAPALPAFVLPLLCVLALGAWRRWPAAAVVVAALAAGVVVGEAGRAGVQACGRAESGRAGVRACGRAVIDSVSVRGRMQRRATATLTSLFGAQRAPLAAALVIDPEARLPRDVRERFARSGLAHILSISGFHVGILAAVVVLLLRAARLPPDRARVAGTLLVAAYVWLIGAPAPAVRSAALVGLWCWAKVRQRPTLPSAALAVTAVVVVSVEPGALLSAGPWLSFAGVWGCMAAGAWWREAARGSPILVRQPVLRALSQSLAVSAGATLATAPVSIVAFGTVTPAAIAANIAAVPLGAFVVPAIALALVLAALPGPFAALAAYPAAAAGLALDGLERVAGWAGGLPLAGISVERRVAGAALAAAVAWLVLRRGTPPLAARAAPWLLAGRLMPAGLLVLAALAWSPVLVRSAAAEAGGRLTLFFLPVGQGDAAVLLTPAGHWMVIDGGPRTPQYDAGARVVAPFLRRHGVRRVAVIVASHGDADHLGGVPAVLRAVPADLALEPGEHDGRPLYREYLAEVARHAARWHPARAGEHFTLDGVTVRVWHPDSAWLERRLPANENSVVLTVEFGRFRALFGGDAGLPMEVERAAGIGAVTVLKVGHHGSRSASGPTWLRTLAPSLCILSVGRNTYGHPDPDVVAALRGSGCAVWRTDRDGVVTLRTDGMRVDVDAATGADTSLALAAPAGR